jgi:MFS family permease
MLTNRTTLTYRHEQWRAVAHGILETAGQTFLLLIAVRVFAASPTAKAMIATGASLGLVLTPVLVWLAARRGWQSARAAAGLALIGAGALAAAAVWPVLPVYVAATVVGMASGSLMVPFLTQMFEENYPAEERGQRFARSVMIRVGVAAVFAELAGRWMSARLEDYRWLLVAYAGAFAFMARCLRRCPTAPLAGDGSAHPFRALRFVREDAVFRRTLICWMLMGFANLMMLPLRVEYLANPRYGLVLSAALIAGLTGVIPNVLRLWLAPVWGWVFDRLNFFALRIVLNTGFAISILTFFTSDSMTGLILGAVIFGISNAGGDVAWTLWVTKFAPPGKVADYMAIHTFFTGLRGVVAPVVAFHLVTKLSVAAVGGISAALIVVASAVLARELRRGPRADPGTRVIEAATKDSSPAG